MRRLPVDELEFAMLVQAAPDCPHYITRARALKGHLTCLGCAVRRVKPRDWHAGIGPDEWITAREVKDAA